LKLLKMSQAESDTKDILYDKDHPFAAKITENRILNKEGSAKDTRHFVVDITGSNLTYNCGDSLGIYPTNHPEYVEEVLRVLGFSGNETINIPKIEKALTIREAFLHKLSLAGPSKKFLQALVEKVTNKHEIAEARNFLEPGARKELMAYLGERELIDFLVETPSAKWQPQELVNLMKRLVPRLYSIASSPSRYPLEIHLTVAVVRYNSNNRDRFGVCTTYLSERVKLNAPIVPVFVASSHFGLPEEQDKDVIMVGPGTGIAPFRSFLQEREENEAKGRNWLFFGDQHIATDYLYSEEFKSWKQNGFLQNLSLAFSRDQEEKVYVQNRMLECGKELWEWLKGGAYFYVCGDAKRMAVDVDQALNQIAREHGDLSEQEARIYVKGLKKEKRYQRDIY
jgi:sulfite reductase (NADPH) flavoprotein alpha-component